MVLLVKCCLLILACFKSSHAISQVFALTFVLFLDISIHLNRFQLLIFYVVVKFNLNAAFQLFIIIDILNDPINSVFKCPDKDGISLDFYSCLFNCCLHHLLSYSEVIHKIAEFSVCLVEITQFFIHEISLKLEVSNFFLSWGDIFLKFFNFEV
jgi:hypothetical protein